ncbi:hypothetical protein LTR62_008280 [Meristemomyces frigidus]|uniref:Major facilitator superfamily (MFS) profile domain-containing protein n=1 Tax=Meristemomyces frigidus TaxID=1508187 RepID=A0AAN7TI66_9PEZI|nr:hypothetical protein LTR62_008280 [Meristemomyces frigidus]
MQEAMGDNDLVRHDSAYSPGPIIEPKAEIARSECYLWTLPAEIRVQILEYVFQDNKLVDTFNSSNQTERPGGIILNEHYAASRELTLLLTSRQMYQDGVLSAFTSTKFVMSSMFIANQVPESLAVLCSKQIAAIRSITFSADARHFRKLIDWGQHPFGIPGLDLDELTIVLHRSSAWHYLFDYTSDITKLLRELRSVKRLVFVRNHARVKGSFKTWFNRLTGLMMKVDHQERYDRQPPNPEQTWWRWSFDDEAQSFCLEACPSKPMVHEQTYVEQMLPLMERWRDSVENEEWNPDPRSRVAYLISAVFTALVLYAPIVNISEIDEVLEYPRSSIDITYATTGENTPDLSRVPTSEHDERLQPLAPAASRGHMGTALENLVNTRSRTSQDLRHDDTFELHPVRSRQTKAGLKPTEPIVFGADGLEEEVGSPTHPVSQGIPPELGSLTKEIVCVLTCGSGQMLFAFFQGNVNVPQTAYQAALALPSTQLPWLVGSFLVALGLSVIISGTLTDLVPPKAIVVSALAWLTIWNLIGCFTLTPSLSILFFFVRAMQGLAVGVLVSGSMSILGRIYSPGRRKTRVFSGMAAMAPFGFWLGALQGGALASHLRWIYGTNTIISALLCAAAFFSIPALSPAVGPGMERAGLRDFDFKGAALAMVACIFILFGLTQGSVAKWAPYTYALIVAGLCILAIFIWVETRVPRPLVPLRLFRTPGFSPLMAAYFLGFGGFAGWQFYALQFFLRLQHKQPIIVACYLLPNAICGVLATFMVSRLLHVVPGHYLYIASMLAFGLGPAFFLPQTPHTTYWALSLPGIALATFGPDLSFAAASIFITSAVDRNYQGSAGSLLVTIQNLSSAIITSVADAIGAQVDLQDDGNIGLEGLRAIWWFCMSITLLGALITALWVRIPKEEEKEHVT